MKLLYEMDPDAVIEHYLISDIRKLKERTGVKRVVEKTHKLRFLKVWYEWFEITNEPEGSILIGMGKDQELDALVEFVTEIIGPIDDRREEKQYKENVEANMQSKFRQSYNDEEVSSSRFKKEDEFVEYVIAEELFNVYLLGEILKFGDTLIEGQKEAAASLESVLALNAL